MRIFSAVLALALVLLQYRLWLSDQGLRECRAFRLPLKVQASANREPG